MKITDFVTIFENQKMSFGPHQGTTYENSHKMTTSEVMLWCQPNNNLVKNINFVKVIECGKNSFGVDQVDKNGSQQQKPILGGRRFTEAK